MSKIIIEKNNNVTPTKERTEKEILRYDAQMRVAVLGQMFMEALEDFKKETGISIMKTTPISSVVSYCEKGVVPIYNAYFNANGDEGMRSIENEYLNLMSLIKTNKTIGKFSILSQTLVARNLDAKSMDATTHRILKKHNLNFLK